MHIVVRRVEPSPGMRDLIPSAFYVAQPADGSARHAAGDTASEAVANWHKRYDATEARHAA